MTPETVATLDLVGMIVGMTLTVFILSYFFIGNSPLYRLALHLLVGTTVGYGAAVVSGTVLLRVVMPAIQADKIERYLMIVPFIGGLLLLFKGFPRWAAWGNYPTAFLIGVGAAVGTAGALLGTIIPQTTASGHFGQWIAAGGWPGILNGLLVTGGTICTLLAFTFIIPRRRSAQNLWNSTFGLGGRIGRLLLLAAFGASFAAALIASLSVLVGRIFAIIEGINQLLNSFGGL